MYNAKNAKETSALPQDAIIDGVITQVNDGKVKNFIQPGTDWKGELDQNAINVVIEVKANDGKALEVKQLFTYNENAGVTEFSPRSNLAKFKKKYGELPNVGCKVKIQTTSEGFGRLKLD